jgi:hypothetical protein
MSHREPEELGRDELLVIVRTVRELLYADVDAEGNAVWDPEHAVNGGDLVQGVAGELEQYGLVPAAGPRGG